MESPVGTDRGQGKSEICWCGTQNTKIVAELQQLGWLLVKLQN